MPISIQNFINPNNIHPNQEIVSEIIDPASKEHKILYFFRNKNMNLFSCTSKTIEEARKLREDWEKSLSIELLEKGTECYWIFYNTTASEDRVNYYYREVTGELFHCQTTTLEKAQKAREGWCFHLLQCKLLQLSPEAHAQVNDFADMLILQHERETRINKKALKTL